MTSALFRTLAAWDDEALADLASKGLLRRAAKDAAAGKVSLRQESAEAAAFEVEGFHVAMTAAGPQAARCDCPASGVCRHILAAVIHSRPGGQDDAAPVDETDAASVEEVEGPAGDPLAEILALDLAELAKWAGKPTCRAALELLSDGPELEVVRGRNLLLRFPGLDLECRYLPQGGPAGMVSKIPQRRRKAVHLAALLAVKQDHGQEITLGLEPPEPATAASLNKRERSFLREVRRLLHDMIDAGLSHLSGGTEQRISTLAVSARGGSLPRLSAELRAMSSDVQSLRRRRADADEGRLFTALCRCHALATALLNADTSDLSSLRGAARQLYRPTGRLSLVGLGAYRWRTRSDSQGLTVLFLCPATKAWHSCSLSRTGEHDSLFDPLHAYAYQQLWAGTGPPSKAARGQVLLEDAKLSPGGRLSLSGETKGQLEPAPTRSEFTASSEIFDDWSVLVGRLAQVLPAGLGLSPPPYVILKPAIWGTRDFDAVAQRFSWQLYDSEGRSLTLQVDYSAVTEARIDWLERLNPKREKVWGVVAAAEARRTAVVLEPLCCLGRDAADRLVAISPDFLKPPGPKRGALRDSLLARVKDRLQRQGAPAGPPAVTAPLTGTARRLASLGEKLQGLAETGQSILGPALQEELRLLASHLSQSGLELLARHVATFVDAESVDPAALVRLNYLLSTVQELDRAIPISPRD